MTNNPPTSSANPTEDVLAAIQDVIDTPHLPFPDRTISRSAEMNALEARIAKLEAGIEFQRDILEIKAELQILRANARSDFRIIVALAIAIAAGLTWLLAKGFHWT
jgi:hypothetical protein